MFYFNHFIFIIIFYEDPYGTVSESSVFLCRLFFVNHKYCICICVTVKSFIKLKKKKIIKKKIPCAIHLSFVKEKQHFIPLLCYIILVIKRLTISQSSRSSIRKNIPFKILAVGNCSAEIFGCSIDVLILWEIMTSSKMILRFQEIIGVLI